MVSPVSDEQIFLGDAIVLWRACVVWEYDRRIVIPSAVLFLFMFGVYTASHTFLRKLISPSILDRGHPRCCRYELQHNIWAIAYVQRQRLSDRHGRHLPVRPDQRLVHIAYHLQDMVRGYIAEVGS